MSSSSSRRLRFKHFYPYYKPSTHEVTDTQAPIKSSTVDESNNRKNDNERRHLLWKLMSSYIPAEKESIQFSFVSHIEYTLARSRFSFDSLSGYLAVSYSIRDRLIELFNDTNEYFISSKTRQVCFVSMEFHMGRFLRNALLNMELEDIYRISLDELGVSLDSLLSEEYDPGLGKDGLGRLAACLMDSLATLNLPGWGYGLMFSFGMFKQVIMPDGNQLEVPDYWLNYGNPWRIQKETISHQVCFFGRVENEVWKPSLTINAMANDFLIPGYGTDNTIALRLWSSKPSPELDQEKFRGYDYYEALSEKQWCENLTSILYPSDNKAKGKEMLLMQEYFLSAATLADIISQLNDKYNEDIRQLPKFWAIHLNDTHPVIMIVELIRILIDEKGISLPEALDISRQVFSFTCHKIIPEEHEKWDIVLFENILPRHFQIIKNLNSYYLDEVRRTNNVSNEVLKRISIIDGSDPTKINMTNLALMGTNKVNGISEMHTELMKKKIFPDFYRIKPEVFCNITNGVSIRRWLNHCNPRLSEIISDVCNYELWPSEAKKLQMLYNVQNDIHFIDRWNSAKEYNKIRLAQLVKEKTDIVLSPKTQLFDVHIKRIHETKRQHLNIFSIINRYLNILDMTPSEKEICLPRAVIFAGKASPSDSNAKKIIKLIVNVSQIINQDPNVGDLLKVVFIPNYNVSIAEIIIPGTDISEHISTAGTEASGTSNLKFAMNGSLIIGTHDGVNIEIAKAADCGNVFFFGALESEVDDYRSLPVKPIPIALSHVFDTIRSGLFGDPYEYECILQAIENGDKHLVAHDFTDYIETQNKCDEAYKNRTEWTKTCIGTTAGMFHFSSDRAIGEYAEKIWKIEKSKLPFVSPSDGGSPCDSIGSTGSNGGRIRRHNSLLSLPRSISKGSFGTHSPLSSLIVSKLHNDNNDDELEYENI